MLTAVAAAVDTQVVMVGAIRADMATQVVMVDIQAAMVDTLADMVCTLTSLLIFDALRLEIGNNLVFFDVYHCVLNHS